VTEIDSSHPKRVATLPCEI